MVIVARASFEFATTLPPPSQFCGLQVYTIIPSMMLTVSLLGNCVGVIVLSPPSLLDSVMLPHSILGTCLHEACYLWQ